MAVLFQKSTMSENPELAAVKIKVSAKIQFEMSLWPVKSGSYTTESSSRSPSSTASRTWCRHSRWSRVTAWWMTTLQRSAPSRAASVCAPLPLGRSLVLHAWLCCRPPSWFPKDPSKTWESWLVCMWCEACAWDPRTWTDWVTLTSLWAPVSDRESRIGRTMCEENSTQCLESKPLTLFVDIFLQSTKVYSRRFFFFFFIYG